MRLRATTSHRSWAQHSSVSPEGICRTDISFNCQLCMGHFWPLTPFFCQAPVNLTMKSVEHSLQWRKSLVDPQKPVAVMQPVTTNHHLLSQAWWSKGEEVPWPGLRARAEHPFSIPPAKFLLQKSAPWSSRSVQGSPKDLGVKILVLQLQRRVGQGRG